MTTSDNQRLESYLPVYDVAPETWEEGQPFIVEQLKKISTAVNIRDIGWFLDEEVLTGKAFVPGINNASDGSTSQQFRSILRKVIIYPNGVTNGANPNPMAHGITVDSNFTLIQMYGAATNSTALTGEPLPNRNDYISYDVNNVYVNVAANYDRASIVMEYCQEL